MIFLVFSTFMLAIASTAKEQIDFKNHLSDEFIDYINSVQTLWSAGRNFHVNTPMEHLKKIVGENELGTTKATLQWYDAEDTENLPESFDARENWPMCKSLKEIRDQGDCASGWALALVSTMTDRVCIHSGGQQNFHFSGADLVLCCGISCYMDVYGLCVKGVFHSAWEYYHLNGIVSGGNYNSTNKGCMPYPYQSCYHDQSSDSHVKNNLQEMINCSDIIDPYLYCTAACDPDSNIPYLYDKKYAEKLYILSEDENQIRRDIIKNGPVEAILEVYSDFFSYKSGVYKHVAGNKVGLQGVKILGWGVENNTKYWIAANSWNVYFGENGFFKILRGENHCGIESDIMAAIPLLDNMNVNM